MAEATEIDEKLILKWVNHADLFRIKGVAGQFAELLEASGVDTVKELISGLMIFQHQDLLALQVISLKIQIPDCANNRGFFLPLPFYFILFSYIDITTLIPSTHEKNSIIHISIGYCLRVWFCLQNGHC